MSQNPALAYRPDIDGLRAIAVLAVVFYHFGIGGISGGFVGVDVFFVISGFLITGIIHREIEQGKFTFTGFYERRIRRIFPALFTVLATTLVAGSWLLLPSDLVLLGKSTLATLFFSSNIFFWRNSGYFDSGSELNPLLHTWSLAVEEQFYIGLPILLIVVYRYARAWLKPIIAVLALLSFIGCVLIQGLWPAGAFYLLPFRAWELLLGSYLAVGGLPSVSKPWLRELVSGFGFALLTAGFFLIKAGPQFPGWQALVPVLGTGMLIYANGSGSTKVGALLSLRLVVFVGLISYSLYLWHWPLAAYAKRSIASDLPGNAAMIGVAVSFMLAIASYHWIEKPFRTNKKFYTRRKLAAGSLACITIMALFCVVALKLDGLPNRFSPEIVKLDNARYAERNYAKCMDPRGEVGLRNICKIGTDTDPQTIVLGDSYMEAYLPAIDESFKNLGIASYVIGEHGCPPLLDVDISLKGQENWRCREYNAKVRELLESNKNIKYIFLSAAWDNYISESSGYLMKSGTSQPGADSLASALAKLHSEYAIKNEGRTLIVIGQVPAFDWNVPLKLIQAKIAGYVPPEMSATEWNAKSAPARKVFAEFASQESAYFINVADFFCSNERCNYHDSVDSSQPFYLDHGHLNAAGNNFVRPYLETKFSEIPFIRMRKKIE